MRRARVLVIAVGVLASACREAAPTENTPAQKPAAAIESGMCAEHGVLEAVCTKCKPALIPVFQAKGDWCAEHGFPESFCPTCHPEQGGKPRMDVAKDDAPADGLEVRFKTRDTAELAGIRTVTARKREGGARIGAVVTLAYDATRWATVNARSAGIVKSIKADIGAQVKAGAALAVLESPTVGVDRSRLRGAATRAELAEEAHTRTKALFDEGVAPWMEVLQTRQAWEAAKADKEAAEAALAAVGGGDGPGRYVVTAPIGGTVTQRTITIGQTVGVTDPLFEVVDTSAMWAELDVPEADAPALQLGQQATITLDGLEDEQLEGVITYIAPSVDRHTRTVRVRVPLKNPKGLLRANMFGEARIALGDTRSSVMVPRAAVQKVKDTRIVFVRTAVDVFETRRVQLGITDGELVEIRRGVEAGEEVATAGSFLLKTETLKDSIGAGCCDVE